MVWREHIGRKTRVKESEIRNQEVLDKYLAMVEEDVVKLFDRNKFEKIPCPICSSKDYNEEFEKAGFKYVTCNRCGTLYANPRPTQGQLDVFYSKSDSTRFWVEDFFMPFAEARRQKIFEPRARAFSEEFVEFKNKRIGDIGAGFGLFLEELKKIWPESNLCAIEPSIDMARICQEKGLKVIPKMFEDLKDEDGKFDFLCSFELFEHLNKPRVFLEKANSALEIGGYLLFTTLNGKGFDIQLLWDRHKNVNPPHHLNFANPDAFRLALEDTGFEIVSITTPGRLDWDIVEKMIETGKVNLGRWWKTVCDSSDETKEDLQSWIARNHFSSHIRVVAKKIMDK